MGLDWNSGNSNDDQETTYCRRDSHRRRRRSRRLDRLRLGLPLLPSPLPSPLLSPLLSLSRHQSPRRVSCCGTRGSTTTRVFRPRIDPGFDLSASKNELLAINASPHGSRALAIAIGAAHVHLPARASRHAQCLDFFKNESGTSAASCQALQRIWWRKSEPWSPRGV